MNAPSIAPPRPLLAAWPLFGLRLRTERLELRVLDDELIPVLADVARRGIHADEAMPFVTQWTDRPESEWHSGFAKYFWAQRGRWTPDAWELPFAVLLDGEPIGVQQIGAENFGVVRAFRTGSWLSRWQQGRGIGTEMRAAVLHLGFDGLAGEVAISGAYSFNAASQRVSEKLGYAPNGTRLDLVRDRAEEAVLFRLTRGEWEARPRPPVRIDGLDDRRAAFAAEAGLGARRVLVSRVGSRRSYLVCATPRSGSTSICESLKATGVAGWPDEFFEARFHSRVPRAPHEYFEELGAPDVSHILGPHRGPRRIPEYSSLLGVATYAEHLQRTHRLGTTPNGVFGAKLMWGHLADLTQFARAMDAYRTLPLAGLLHELVGNPRYVWVTRRDKVRQAVSLWRAIQTSVWRHGEDDDDMADLRYSSDALRHLVRRLVDHDTGWELFFAQASIEPLVLTYEDDLLPDPHGSGRQGARLYIGVGRTGRCRPVDADDAPGGRDQRTVGGEVRRRERRSLAPGSRMTPPNVIYLHSRHQTRAGGRAALRATTIPTPNIQLLADQGVLFRHAFSAAPTCSGSRAALLTGQYPHSNGMMGLAHRGWSLDDYSPAHRAHRCARRATGRRSSASSTSRRRSTISATTSCTAVARNHVESAAPRAVEVLRGGIPEPFFMSVGFFETHRDFFEPSSVRDVLYSLPPSNLPDTAAVREDMAAFKASARSLDQGVGRVLNALQSAGLAERTLVICTTDHGLAFPGAKGTLFDRGTGVMFVLRGPGRFSGGRVFDQLVSQIDLYPTLCELAGCRTTRSSPAARRSSRWCAGRPPRFATPCSPS